MYIFLAGSKEHDSLHPLKVFFWGQGDGERLGLSASTHEVYTISF